MVTEYGINGLIKDVWWEYRVICLVVFIMYYLGIVKTFTKYYTKNSMLDPIFHKRNVV